MKIVAFTFSHDILLTVDGYWRLMRWVITSGSEAWEDLLTCNLEVWILSSGVDKFSR